MLVTNVSIGGKWVQLIAKELACCEVLVGGSGNPSLLGT